MATFQFQLVFFDLGRVGQNREGFEDSLFYGIPSVEKLLNYRIRE